MKKVEYIDSSGAHVVDYCGDDAALKAHNERQAAALQAQRDAENQKRREEAARPYCFAGLANRRKCRPDCAFYAGNDARGIICILASRERPTVRPEGHFCGFAGAKCEKKCSMFIGGECRLACFGGNGNG